MDGDHQVFRDETFAQAFDDVVRAVKSKALCRPFILELRDLVPHADLVAIPAAAGVGEVKDLRKVRV